MYSRRDTAAWQSGFTLVELLIVIVVIAILAAIATVSYNGISDRAIETKMVSTANTLEKKVKLKAVTDGKASPTSNPSTAEQTRQHYQIDDAGDNIVVTTHAVNGACVASLSDTCDYEDPIYDRNDIVRMEIYSEGTSGGCQSSGGVLIWHPWLTKEDWNVIEIPDDPDLGVGISCSAAV